MGRNSRLAVTCSRWVWRSRSGSRRSSSSGRRSTSRSPRWTTSSFTWRRWRTGSCPKTSRYLQGSSASPPISTSTVMLGLALAARHRISETPARLATAWPRPPLTATRSPRKRKTSRKFDLPEALGPTRKFRSWSGRSTRLKLRQFWRRTWAKRRVERAADDLRVLILRSPWCRNPGPGVASRDAARGARRARTGSDPGLGRRQRPVDGRAPTPELGRALGQAGLDRGPQVLGDAHAAVLGAAHGAEVGPLGRRRRQRRVVHGARGDGVEAEVELIFPAELEPGPGEGVVPLPGPGMVLGQVGGVGRDPVGDDPVLDVLPVGQAQMLLGGDVAEHGRTQLADDGRPDGRGDVVVAGGDVGGQRPPGVEGGVVAELPLQLHVLPDAVERH